MRRPTEYLRFAGPLDGKGGGNRCDVGKGGKGGGPWGGKLGGTFILEKAVETAVDAERPGLEVKRPRTLEGTPKPSMDWVVQSLPLRNRRPLRLNELPVLGSWSQPSPVHSAINAGIMGAASRPRGKLQPMTHPAAPSALISTLPPRPTGRPPPRDPPMRFSQVTSTSAPRSGSRLGSPLETWIFELRTPSRFSSPLHPCRAPATTASGSHPPTHRSRPPPPPPPRSWPDPEASTART